MAYMCSEDIFKNGIFLKWLHYIEALLKWKTHLCQALVGRIWDA